MALIVQCPNPTCRKNCSVAESLSDAPVQCPQCGKPFRIKPTLDGHKTDTNKNQPSSNTNPFPVLPAEFGRYRVLKLLGKGGMGAVYLAQDSQLGRQVALKIPFFDAVESPQRAERFVREARSAAALHHPNICTVFDAGQIDGRPFLTMAYLAGKPLEDEIDPDAPMPQLRAAEIARKIALALEHAHRKGIVHRDLKPANVMMSADDGEPVVMDFGLAKRFGEVAEGESKLTHAGTLLGTPSYMSPEQVRGNAQAVGPATDVYSLGVMLFEMLTGNTPYTGAFRVIVGQILAAPVPPVKEFRPDVDARLDAICRKAMAKKPAERFASMAEFANALGQYLKAPQSSPPPLAAPLAILVPQAPTPTVAYSPFGDLAEASTPTHAAKKKNTRRAVAVALALLLPLVCWLAVVLLRVETPNGTLVVERNKDTPDLNADRQAAEDKALVSLFNGKDLTGWEGLPGYWRVEGGAIVGSLTNDPGFNTFLCSKKTYSDFELRCQVRLKGGIGNSGVQIRSKLEDDKKFIVAGPQGDMGGGYWGSLYGERFGGMMKQSPGELVKQVVKKDDFNNYYIKCVGKHVTIEINGKTMVEGDFPAMPEEGIIAWQLHTGFKSMEVTFKDIQFTNLSKPRADGFASLFNGKDLIGWKTHPNQPGKWRVENGILIGSGPADSYLYTDRGDYKNFHLRAETRINDGGNSGVRFRSLFGPWVPADNPRFLLGYEAQINSTHTDVPKTGSLYAIPGGVVVSVREAPVPPGQWFTLEVIAEREHLVIKVNGKTTVNYTDEKRRFTSGHIALQQFERQTVVEFRKIEIKELTAGK